MLKFVMRSKATLFILAAYCCVFVIFTSHCCSAQTTVRPYQFGFTIKEQQHRYEKRDERGIVMGEFGFITADGIYHVTVYATDEEGRFRILAMKNYPYESPRKTINMEIVRQNPIPTQQPATTEATRTTNHLSVKNFGQMACSSCFLPKKNTKYPKDEGGKRKNEIRPLSRAFGSESPGTTSNTPAVIPEAKVPKMIKEIAKIATNTIITKTTPKISSKTSVGIDTRPSTYPTYTEDEYTDTQTESDYNATPTTPGFVDTPQTQTRQLTSNTGDSFGPVLPSGTSRPDTPSSVNPSASNGKNIPNDKKNFGSTMRQDENGDLYRFKYILDYNGHTETGGRDGNKKGNYFAIGDDNVERTVEYVANEFGFQPKIRWRKLTPNEIQSKENTLKEYEFVWFDKP